MVKSKEWPDLEWIPPKSKTDDNRTKSDIKWVVIHDTEGSYHGTSAEDGARYNQRRTDGTSAHYFVDNNSVVHCVLSEDRAHTARATGNRYGIQYELCGRANWSQATWLNEYGSAMLDRAARQVARDCKKFDIPVRHLTVAQVANGERGVCSHWDITRAFPQDNGTHTDPGPNFPWTWFLNRVRAYLAPPPVEDDVALTDAEVNKVRDAVWAKIFQIPGTTGPDGQRTAGTLLQYLYSKESIAARVDELVDDEGILAKLNTLSADVAALREAVDELAAGHDDGTGGTADTVQV